MKILMIGDIYGKTGRDALQNLLPELQARYQPDWVIANGENVTAGNGLSAKHANFIKACGVDIITTGNHIFSRPEWPELLTRNDFILRPHNITAATVGSGVRVFHKPKVGDLAVINLAGRVFMDHADCPFAIFDQLHAGLPGSMPLVVDLHAEATSEKLAFFWHVNGRATVAYGTHTHVQTSDERLLPDGNTAVITDIGMTGAVDGVIGVDRHTVTGRFISGFSDKFLCAPPPGKVEGIVVESDEKGRATSIERFRLFEKN
ncbi:MAG TPA: TIGR00282 family metallophosphoesterase [Candidatus Rifleibacterium sp.]|nr:TIGR00282 family metallophosphoesterase [Candidatus Rifleibacterium sp.]HPT45617.1 TIGR00282 family metallophosphoesterase [Candidatus Rifleibacterium sp.]